MVLLSATLIHFKKNRQQWTAFLDDKTKVYLPLQNLKIAEDGNLRDIRQQECRPKPERQKPVILELEDGSPLPVVKAWALAPA